MNEQAASPVTSAKHHVGLRWLAQTLVVLGLLVCSTALFAADAGFWSWMGLLLGAVALAAFIYLQVAAGGLARDQRLLPALRAANGDQSDLRQLVAGGTEQGELDGQINRFLSRTSDILSLLLKQSLKVALASADARKLSVKSQSSASRQAELSDLIFQSSEETTRALGDLSQRTNGIADANSLNLEVARQSLVELERVMEHVESSALVMGDFGETVKRLVKSSENIRAILDTVQAFAAQTNMLALNAAIEAARAGEHGRGFAVVADEVRSLAGKVGSAADQINELVVEMGNVVAHTSSSTQSATVSTDDAKHAIATTLGDFQSMVAKFERTNDDLLMVGSTVEELSHSNEEALQRAKEIRELGEEIRRNMEESFVHADVMRDTTNIALQQLAKYRLQNGILEPMVHTLVERRDLVAAKLEELMNEGVDIFDRNYKAVANSKMGKYEVSYGDAFRRKLQGLVDEWHRDSLAKGIIYWLPSDDRSYLAINRSELSRPETGDLKVDAHHSRYMFFSVTNEVELQNVANCGEISMGTFVVPTGQSVITIFVPIHVKGRRWGSFAVGALPAAFGL